MAVITAFVGSCPNLSEKTHSDKLLNIPSEQVNEWKYFTLTIILPAQRAFCWSNWARCRHPTVLVFFFLNAKAQTAFSPTSNQGTAIETTCTDVVSLSKAINFCPVTLHIIPFAENQKEAFFQQVVYMSVLAPCYQVSIIWRSISLHRVYHFMTTVYPC